MFLANLDSNTSTQSLIIVPTVPDQCSRRELDANVWILAEYRCCALLSFSKVCCETGHWTLHAIFRRN